MKKRFLKTMKRKTMKRNKKTLTVKLSNPYTYRKKHLLKGGMTPEEAKALAARFKKPAQNPGPVTITQAYAARPAEIVRFSDSAVERNMMNQLNKNNPGIIDVYNAQRVPN